MNYKNTTQVPNKLFELLPKLGLKELKVLLIIIRQTIGWKKQRDWLSQSFLAKRTGLSKKSVSSAIQLLIKEQLIHCYNEFNQEIHDPKKRRLQSRLYFSCSDTLIEKSSLHSKKKSNTTKPTHTKGSVKKKRLSDKERLLQLLQGE